MDVSIVCLVETGGDSCGADLIRTAMGIHFIEFRGFEEKPGFVTLCLEYSSCEVQSGEGAASLLFLF